jgi:hypothetical protein
MVRGIHLRCVGLGRCNYGHELYVAVAGAAFYGDRID